MKALSTRYFRGWHVVAVLVLAFALLPLVPARRGKAQAPTTTYTIIDLGTLGGTESVAYGINDCAQVVGDASLSGASPKHPFIWRDANNDGDSDPGEMQDLGTFAGGSGTGSAINSSAYVAGDSVAVDPRAFRWHDPGPLESLGVLPGDVISLAYDINDSSQVVGMSESAFLTDRAFIWQNGSMQAVPTLNSITPMVARGINNGGRIVGIATNLHAFVHTGATNIDLGTFGGNLSIAYEISDDNRVVGYAETTSPNANVPKRAFIWHDDDSDSVSDPGELKNLGTLGGTHSTAYDINSSAYVVGSADISSGADPRRAFIWHDDNANGSNDSGEMKDLNTLIPAADALNWTLQEARSINDGGQIVGFGLISGKIHAFLLTPTGYMPPACAPPPSTVSNVSGSGVYNGTGTLTATLSAFGSPLGGKPIVFTLNSVNVGTANTAANGVATLTGVSLSGINAGTYPAAVGASFAGDTEFAGSGASGTLTVSKANQTITFGALANKTFGDADFTISATASSGLPVSFGASGNCTVSGNTVHITGAGSCTITASQAGDSNYNAASSIQQSFQIGKGAATVTLSNLIQTYDGTPKFASASTNPPGLNVTITYSQNNVPVSSPTNVGSYDVSATINDPNYQGSTTGTLVINYPPPVIFAEDGTNNAIAINSVTFVRGPFRIVDGHNFSADQRTRIILFTSNLSLSQPDSSLLSVQASGFDLPVENVGAFTGIPGLDASYIVVRLPDNLPPGDLQLTVTLRGATSIARILSIVQ